MGSSLLSAAVRCPVLAPGEEGEGQPPTHTPAARDMHSKGSVSCGKKL